MKLLRVGEIGKEIPAALDAENKLRDLSGIVADIAGETLSSHSLSRLKALDLSTLPFISEGIRIGACVGGVRNFIAVGLNYADRAAESKMAVPVDPVLFNKVPSYIVGPNNDVLIPPGSLKTDWEVELAVVIGERSSYVSESHALDYIAGYCVCNDVSERAYQIEGTGQWTKGKGCPTFGPLGPWLVTRDEIADVQKLKLWLDLNWSACAERQYIHHGLWRCAPCRIYLAPGGANALSLSGSVSGGNLDALISEQPTYLPYVNTSATGNKINDWTIGVSYFPVATATTTKLLLVPYSIAADSVGNIWIMNTGATPGQITELDPFGNPVFEGESACAANPCVLIDFDITSYKIGTTTTAVGPIPGGLSPSGLAIDTANNVWVLDRTSNRNIFKIAGSGTGSTQNGGGATGSTPAVGYKLAGTSASPVRVAVDANDNPWHSETVSSPAPNASCTSQSEFSGGSQILGTVKAGVAVLAAPEVSLRHRLLSMPTIPAAQRARRRYAIQWSTTSSPLASEERHSRHDAVTPHLSYTRKYPAL
jgi:2,4-didehydro-3-deoxy-L-rhamnonate hydrolase